MKRTALFFALIIITLSRSGAQSPVDRGLLVINKNSLQAQVGFLSSDWFKGREATTDGAYMAADYLASLYRQMGVTPAGDDSTYFQKVPLTVFESPAKPTLSVDKGGVTIRFKPGQEFSIPQVTMGYKINGKVAWMGYGTTINSKTKELEGKVGLRLAGQPANQNLQPKELEELKNKNLMNSGVIAMLEYDPEDPNLEKHFKAGTQNQSPAEKAVSGIYSKRLLLPGEVGMTTPVIKITKTVLSQLMQDADNQIGSFIASQKQPSVTGTVETGVRINAESKACRNVLAMIEGSEYPDEIIVVGGHYDHLGTYNGFIWNGADDNASGAIGTAMIAAAFKATGVKPKRTVIFANWTAEERGLLGSRYFVSKFKNTGRIKYYHNYDMIGRSYDFKKSDMAVAMMYTDTWKEAGELTTKFNKDYNLGLNINLSAWDNPVSGSDNASFARIGIPIMWYHTGGHPDYHQPGDHSDKIDWEKMESIIKNSFLTLWELANQ
jgi:hypothetical protein